MDEENNKLNLEEKYSQDINLKRNHEQKIKGIDISLHMDNLSVFFFDNESNIPFARVTLSRMEVVY